VCLTVFVHPVFAPMGVAIPIAVSAFSDELACGGEAEAPREGGHAALRSAHYAHTWRRTIKGWSRLEQITQQRESRDKEDRGADDLVERATCGLRISPTPTSDNLNPQETTNPDAPDMGLDGADLSCPGSSVVADVDEELSSPAE
jgi:hypothetical protein